MGTITSEQRKLVEDNHNLIYEFLHRHNLSVDEYYDIIAIGLCKAAIGYNKNKSKFSTYAFKVMKNELFIHYRETSRVKDIPDYKIVYYNDKIESDDGNEKDTAEGLNYLPAPADTEQEAILNVTLDRFRESLSARNKDIVYLYIRGHSQREIGRLLHLSQAQVSRVLKSIKNYITA